MAYTSGEGDRPQPVERMSDHELEGRLGAHRYLLARLLAQLATDSGQRKALFDWLDERASISDHQEDPGAVIVAGFVEQQARADEFKIISDAVRRQVERTGGTE